MASRVGWIVALVLLAFVTAARQVRAQDAGLLEGTHAASQLLAVDIVQFDANAGEDIHITGSLLAKAVIKYASPLDPCKVVTSFKNGKDLVGVGMTSGTPYTVSGKGKTKYVWVPPNPIKALDHTGVLIAVPPNPTVPPNPVRVHIHYDADPLTGDFTGVSLEHLTAPVVNTCTAIAQVCN